MSWFSKHLYEVPPWFVPFGKPHYTNFGFAQDDRQTHYKDWNRGIKAAGEAAAPGYDVPCGTVDARRSVYTFICINIPSDTSARGGRGGLSPRFDVCPLFISDIVALLLYKVHKNNLAC